MKHLNFETSSFCFSVSLLLLRLMNIETMKQLNFETFTK
jgi:hypothetical protein